MLSAALRGISATVTTRLRTSARWGNRRGKETKGAGNNNNNNRKRYDNIRALVLNLGREKGGMLRSTSAIYETESASVDVSFFCSASFFSFSFHGSSTS